MFEQASRPHTANAHHKSGRWWPHVRQLTPHQGYKDTAEQQLLLNLHPMDLPITSGVCASVPTNNGTRRMARPGTQPPSTSFTHAGGQPRDFRRRELFHQPPRHQYRAVSVVRAAKASAIAEPALKAGDLIDFTKDKERSALGLVQQQDGKKNVWVLEAQAQGVRKTSIQPRQVLFKLPGGPFNEAQLTEFAAAALADAAPRTTGTGNKANAQLGDAWEMAVADNISSLSLQELAGLIMEDESALSLFRCYRMLGADRLYFKQITKGVTDEPMYEPRTAAMVEAARVLLAAEAEAREDEAAWSAAVRDALSKRKRTDQPSPEQWETGRHKRRVAALKALATQDVGPLPSDTLKLAQQSLALAGIIAPSTSATNPAAPAAASPLAEAATNLLVDMRAWRRHEPVAALRKGALVPLPESLEAEAQALLLSPPVDSCAAIRVDLTHLRSYTIDDSGTTEIDDALSVEFLNQPEEQEVGQQGSGDPVPVWPAIRLWAHVADPTRWLTPNCQLVDVARSRTRTLYFPWGCSTMFPRSLAEGPFSLRMQEESSALSISVVLNSDGSLGQAQVVPSRIRVSHRLTYDQADELISQSVQGSTEAVQGDAGVARELGVLRRAADLRRQYREASGAIEIPLPEAKVHVEASQLDAGRPHVTLQRLSQWESASRGLVAEMMILAGEAAGSIGAAASLPLPYRGQPTPALPPASELEALEGVCKGYRLRRCMTRSGVSPQPQRHASLGLDAYVQVTSPIRRWADIVAHFQLKAYLCGQPLPFTSADIDAINMAASSDRVRELGAAERLEESYWITEYFRQQSTSKIVQQWSATVLGWQRQEMRLASVLIDELGYEVVVKVDVDVSPGDYVTLALLEARPVANMLRFYVTDYMSSSPPGEVEDMSDIWPSVDDTASSLSALDSESSADEDAAVTLADQQAEVNEQLMPAQC